ncbi:MAG: hypothetical protein M5U14_00840 [Acidimicrobiia bacterium]|nr:hypothetical protein [Acidimicrobiia bacterium]
MRRSRLERCGYNGAIFVDPDQGPISNVLVEDSYLQGSNFSFWAIPSANNVPWGPPTGVVVRRTVFGGATPRPGLLRQRLDQLPRLRLARQPRPRRQPRLAVQDRTLTEP